MTSSQETLSLRPLCCELSLLSRADGSASFSHGDGTSVMACVYGPTDVRISKEKLDRATIEVLVKPKIGMPSCASKLKEEIIRNSIEASVIGNLHPRTAINVIVQEVQGHGATGGSLLAASINACCVALMDAGIPMHRMFAAVTCACVPKDQETKEHEDNLDLVLDPTDEQEEMATTVLTFAFESREKKIVASHFGGKSSGFLTDTKLHECLSLCSEASEQIFQFYRDCVKQKMDIDSPSVAKTNLVTVSAVESS